MAKVKLVKSDLSRALKLAADDDTLEELGRAKAVLEGHGPGGDMRKLLKQPTPALLTLLLGRHCNLVTLQVQHPSDTIQGCWASACQADIQQDLLGVFVPKYLHMLHVYIAL